MKRKKIAAYLCMTVLLTATGCGNTGAEPPMQTVDTAGADMQSQSQADENTETDAEKEKENVSEENNEESGDSAEDVVSEEPADKQADTTLNGIVVSIGNNSAVVSEVVSEAPEELNGVSLYGASEGEDITTYFSEGTQFEFRTVKNNGVNGDADVTNREGSLADIKEGMSLDMTGSYQGDDFYAEQVIIYNFV